MTTFPELIVERLTVKFGGLLAVDDFSLSAPPATITGLLGPNGAGKTTTFNACAGTVSSAAGSIYLGDQCLDHHSPANRARRGLGRTFQRMELFDSMTVSENVALGPEAAYAGRSPWAQVFAPRSQQRDIASRCEDAIERCGLVSVRLKVAGQLSTGQRRLVELARVIASPFRFLLLDEPSSGLDVSETVEFGNILGEIVAETGIGILLVEHDMALVAAVCSNVYVLDFGRLIYAGTTAETLASDVVRSAYLGSEAAEAAAVSPTIALGVANRV